MDETVCGAPHPNLPASVACTEPPGPNAATDEGREVHVHKGADGEGTHRWEDA